MARTDPDLAEKAKQRANQAATTPYRLIGLLCPACNEPYFAEDPNPNAFMHDPDAGDGEHGLDRAAFQISPASIADRDREKEWDRICVHPEQIETDSGTHLRVHYSRHDFSADAYQAWQEELEELKENQRRAEENQNLGEFE